jgi:hypothetical protein
MTAWVAIPTPGGTFDGDGFTDEEDFSHWSK